MATNDLLVGYTRRFASPVDSSTVFASLSALNNYASSDPTAYVGQICAVTGNNTVYIINSDKTVSAVSGGSGGGGGSGPALSNSTPTSLASSASAGSSSEASRADHVHPLPPASLISGLATVATSGAYSDLTGKPSLATVATSGGYSDLTGKPSLATVATTGAYSDLTGKPTLATVATTGSYNDLSNKPTNAGATFPNATNIKIVCDAIAGGSVVLPIFSNSGSNISYLGTASDGVRWMLLNAGADMWYVSTISSSETVNPSNPGGSINNSQIVAISTNRVSSLASVLWSRVTYSSTISDFVTVSGNISVVNPYFYSQPLATTGSDGTSTISARADHVHPLPSAITPTAHKSTHATGGSDSLTPSDIGAAAASHTHTASQISDSTTVGRTLLTATDTTAQRNALGLGATNTPTLAGVALSDVYPGASPGVLSVGEYQLRFNGSEMVSNEAPVDGTPYARQDRGWVSLSAGGSSNLPAEIVFTYDSLSTYGGAVTLTAAGQPILEIANLGSDYTFNFLDSPYASVNLPNASAANFYPTNLVSDIGQSVSFSGITGLNDYGGITYLNGYEISTDGTNLYLGSTPVGGSGGGPFTSTFGLADYQTAGDQHSYPAPWMVFGGYFNGGTPYEFFQTGCDKDGYNGYISVQTANIQTIQLDNSTFYGGGPSSPQPGQIYFDAGDNHFYGYNGSTWKQLDH